MRQPSSYNTRQIIENSENIGAAQRGAKRSASKKIISSSGGISEA